MSGAPPENERGPDEVVVGGSVLALVNQTPGGDDRPPRPGSAALADPDRPARPGGLHRRRPHRRLAADPHDVRPPSGRRSARSWPTPGCGPCGLNISRHSLVDPERADEHLDYSLRAVDAAVELGVPLLGVGFHPRLVPAQQAGPDVLGGRRRRRPTAPTPPGTWPPTGCGSCARTPAERGVQVSIELYEDTLVCTAADIDRIITAVGAPNLGVNPDLGNTFRSVTPQREHWLQTFRGALPHMDFWHVKNYTRASLGRRRPVRRRPHRRSARA